MSLFNIDNYWGNIFEYYKKNILANIGISILTLIICYFSDKLYILSLITLIVVTFVTWFGHYLLHNYCKYNPISWIHSITHHSPFRHTFMGKFIEYVVLEFFFFGGGILLLIVLYLHSIYHYFILNPYVILWWSIAVPYIHEMHYHILEFSKFHKAHHENSAYNYSPDNWDVIMNTKENNTHFENEVAVLPHLLLLSILIIYFINSPIDFIKYFSN